MSDVLRIEKLLRAADGSSQPWHCLLNDGSPWLVKFRGAGPGVDALLAEFIANGLGRRWGLPIPDSQPVLLDPSVPRAGTDEFWDVLAASGGWNLAIATIPDAIDLKPTVDLPSSTLSAILAYDTLMANWDRTSVSGNLMKDDHGAIWWIDHGSCRFLHRLAEQQRPDLPATHFLFDAQERIRSTLLPMVDRRHLEELIAAVPDQWLAEAPFERATLASSLFGYLERSLR